MDSRSLDLSAVARELLGAAERRDLPTLSREELYASGVDLTHGADRAWLDSLSERERGLVQAAGLRSLVARGLISRAGDALEIAPEMIVLLSAIRFPDWILLLTEAASPLQILIRGVTGTEVCVVASCHRGVHIHALATRDAALREAVEWTVRDGEIGTVRTLAAHSALDDEQTLLEVLCSEGGLVADGTRLPTPDLAAWIQRATTAMPVCG